MTGGEWIQPQDARAVSEGVDMNQPRDKITRIPLTIVSSVDGARTDGVLVGVLASELDELAARVAVVRPTRDQIAGTIVMWMDRRAPHTATPFALELADAVLALFGVAVSDSQETPDKGREE